MNANNNLNPGSNGYVFYSNVPTLEKLASFHVAQNIYRKEIIDHPLKLYSPSSDDVVKKFNAEYDLSLHACLRNRVSKCIRQIRKELENWFRGRYDGMHRVTFVNSDDTWIKYYDELVWSLEDYTIDCMETCINLLGTDRLSKYEKFAMACTYCLEDHIKDLWTRVSGSRKMNGRKNPFKGYVPSWPLLFWINYMRNETSGGNISNTFYEDDMIDNMHLNQWAIEYFWPYLSFYGQFETVISMIDVKDSICLINLLPELRPSDLHEIFSQRGADIMKVLIKDAKCGSLVVPFWNSLKFMFYPDQFFHLVEWMLLSEAQDSLCKEEVSLCQQIWASASGRLKNHTTYSVSHLNNSAFKKAIASQSKPYCDKAILKMVLFEANSRQREYIWEYNWVKFCIHGIKSDMNRLLELCLSDDSKKMEFKKMDKMPLQYFKKHCFSLIDHSKFTELDDFLEFCSVDLDASLELKKRVVSLYLSKTYFGRIERSRRCVDEIIRIINGTFPDPEQCACFKREFVSSPDYLNRIVRLMCDQEFAPIKNLAIACLPNEQEMLTWKGKLRYYCHYSLSRGSPSEFDSSRWQDFMMWCFGSEEKIKEFKESLDVLRIF